MKLVLLLLGALIAGFDFASISARKNEPEVGPNPLQLDSFNAVEYDEQEEQEQDLEDIEDQVHVTQHRYLRSPTSQSSRSLADSNPLEAAFSIPMVSPFSNTSFTLPKLTLKETRRKAKKCSYRLGLVGVEFWNGQVDGKKGGKGGRIMFALYCTPHTHTHTHTHTHSHTHTRTL